MQLICHKQNLRFVVVKSHIKNAHALIITHYKLNWNININDLIQFFDQNVQQNPSSIDSITLHSSWALWSVFTILFTLENAASIDAVSLLAEDRVVGKLLDISLFSVATPMRAWRRLKLISWRKAGVRVLFFGEDHSIEKLTNRLFSEIRYYCFLIQV